MVRRRSTLVALVALAASCGASPDAATDAAPARDAAPYPCAPGEFTPAAIDGHCEPAGVPPSMCGHGFVPDGDGGCAPVLPPPQCPDGQVAWLGDTTCHEIVDCGDGAWGNIPVDASTVFVDQSYAGASSDGSQSAPWRTIKDGVDHAAANAIVAVAAGTYAELVTIAERPVRLWGRCPRLVQIAFPPGGIGEVPQVAYAVGTELHAVAFRAVPHGAIGLDGLLDGVWSRILIYSGATADGTGLTVRASLLEASLTATTNLWMERSIVRGATDSNALTVEGPSLSVILRGSILERGVLCLSVLSDDARVDLTESLLRDAMGDGITSSGNVALNITSSVFQDLGATAIDISGAGAARIAATTIRDCTTAGVRVDIGAVPDPLTQVPIDLTAMRIAGTPCALCFTNGVRATASGIRIAEGSLGGDGAFLGVLATSQSLQTGHVHPVTLTLAGSVVDSAAGAGVFVIDATAEVVGSVIRATRPFTNGLYGDGIGLERSDRPTSLRVTASRIEANARAGVANFGGDAVIGDVALVDDAIDIDGERQGAFAPTFVDQGGNVCSAAGTPHACAAQTTGISPPPPSATP